MPEPKGPLLSLSRRERNFGMVFQGKVHRRHLTHRWYQIGIKFVNTGGLVPSIQFAWGILAALGEYTLPEWLGHAGEI